MTKIAAGNSSLVGAFRTHKKVVGTSCTHHMVLFYAVECGLKALACSPQYAIRPKTISDVVLDKGGAATTHRLNELVSHLKLPANVGKCPDIKLSKGSSTVSIDHGDIHQAWRYGVKVDSATETDAIKWLKKMVALIDSKI